MEEKSKKKNKGRRSARPTTQNIPSNEPEAASTSKKLPSKEKKNKGRRSARPTTQNIPSNEPEAASTSKKLPSKEKKNKGRRSARPTTQNIPSNEPEAASTSKKLPSKDSKNLESDFPNLQISSKSAQASSKSDHSSQQGNFKSGQSSQTWSKSSQSSQPSSSKPGQSPQQASSKPGHTSQQASFRPSYSSQQASSNPGHASQQASSKPGQSFKQETFKPDQSSLQASFEPGHSTQTWSKPSQSSQKASSKPGQSSQPPRSKGGHSSQQGQPTERAWSKSSQSTQQASSTTSQSSQQGSSKPGQSSQRGQPTERAWSKSSQSTQQTSSTTSQSSQQGSSKAGQSFQQAVSKPLQSSQLGGSSQQVSRKSSTIERGTCGKQFEVETNYLSINLKNMPKLAYHYDITIVPDRPKKFLRQVFEQFNILYFKNIAMAFDNNKNVYTIQKLPCTHFEKEVEIFDKNMRPMKYVVSIKETENLNIDLDSLRTYSETRIFDKPMRALQCLDVVLSNPCHSKGVRIGRSFFSRPDEFYDLYDGYEMWTGLFQAAILGDVPFLNVDISNKSFYSEGALTNFLQNKFGQNILHNVLGRELYAFRSYIKGVNILYEPPKIFGVAPKIFKVVDVTELPASKLTFVLDSKTMTVDEYFKSRGYSLLYPKLNCLQVGSSVKKIYLPLECCKVHGGQAPNKKDGARQVQQMIKYAATSTNVRKMKIEKALKYFLHNNDNVVNKFGISIDPYFCNVPLRLLNPPGIVYKTDLITPSRGVWQVKDSTQFLRTSNLNYAQKWALIYHQDSKRNFKYFMDFVKMFSEKAKQMNILLEDKPEIIQFYRIDEILRDLKRKKFDLVLTVLPNYNVTYADIKQCAELQFGILTQCIKEITIVKRLNSQLILNILLKVNAKLNGTNHNFKDIEDKNKSFTKVMYLGADVTHPSPDQSFIPSVVGVAASHDAFGACYNMQYRLQKSTVEVIDDMESIVRVHLELYKKYQNSYPEHIIYYRDGVSDGQFPFIKQIELRGIRAACAKLKISVKLTCVVVVKRHHTRFFPKTEGRDKYNNVLPGSVVDRIIVHPNEVQFFMVSHVSVQGTARPTRYNVIEDDANINIDVLQKLTYNMCHMFPRCNRSVSYPAPAYLAHLAAFRGRVYLEGSRRFDEPKKEYEKRKINMDLLQSNPMYFV